MSEDREQLSSQSRVMSEDREQLSSQSRVMCGQHIDHLAITGFLDHTTESKYLPKFFKMLGDTNPIHCPPTSTSEN